MAFRVHAGIKTPPGEQKDKRPPQRGPNGPRSGTPLRRKGMRAAPLRPTVEPEVLKRVTGGRKAVLPY